jgi:hypothetical protein
MTPELGQHGRFAALLQEGRKVPTLTDSSGGLKSDQGSDLTILAGIGTHSFQQQLLNA